jgi:hypothetical protein
MSDNETLLEDSAATPIDDGGEVKRRIFSRITRELTQTELGTTGVQKLSIDEIEKSGAENFELKRFRDNYYQSERELAVAKRALRRQKSDEIISGGTLAIGSAAPGYLPSLRDGQLVRIGETHADQTCRDREFPTLAGRGARSGGAYHSDCRAQQ